MSGGVADYSHRDQAAGVPEQQQHVDPKSNQPLAARRTDKKIDKASHRVAASRSRRRHQLPGPSRSPSASRTRVTATPSSSGKALDSAPKEQQSRQKYAASPPRRGPALEDVVLAKPGRLDGRRSPTVLPSAGSEARNTAPERYNSGQAVTDSGSENGPGLAFAWPRLHSPSTTIVPMSRKRKAIVTSIVAAAVLVAFVVLVVFKKSPWQHRRTLRYCATPDCVAHAEMLTAQLNQSVDPCEDFYAYVCSSWGRSGLGREHIKTPVDQMSIARMSHFGTMLNRGTLKLRVGAKALSLYESCMSGREGEGLSVERFRALMRDMNLYWPEPPPRNLSPLEVHLTLSCKWRVHLLLQVWVLAVPDTGKWRVVLQTAPLVPVALNHYRIVKESGGYGAYWKGFYTTMRTNTTAQEDDASIEAAISETNDLDNTVLNRLSQFIFDQPQNPASFQLGNIAAHARHVTKDMWIRALRKSANVNPILGASDYVLISSDRLLDTIDDIFENYTHSQLLMHVAWLFVQFYSPIAEPSMLLSHFGDANLASIYRSVFCAAHVEASYKVLVLSLDIASHISPEDQQAVVGGFERLVSAAVDTINNSTWLDDDSKQIARQKLTSVRLEAWPSEQLQTNAQLESIYAQYPDEGDSFADIWVRIRRAIHSAGEKVRHTNESQEYYELLTLPMNMAPSYPYYSYALQTLKVPIYAINNPLYYRRGTDAMFYGGLGYLLALNLVKALDKVGVRWHLNGTNVDFILSDGDRDAFEEKNSCLKEEGASVFPELPALEVAYTAMQSVHTTDLQDLGNDLGPAKVFFLTLCFMACSLPGFKSAFAVDCNRVVRNSPAFANAFACSDKAKMNPAKKCGFFA